MEKIQSIIFDERWSIILWLIPLGCLYLLGILPWAVLIIVLLGVCEILKREPHSWATYGALVHMAGFLCTLAMNRTELSFLFLVVIVNDVVAYFGGKNFNFFPAMQKKIFPMSPNKTLGGFLYGVVGGFLVGLALIIFLELPETYVFMAILLPLVAVVGDLLESSFKRFYGIKDSGDDFFTKKLMLGHGGIFDRFDAVSLCALVFYAFSK